MEILFSKASFHIKIQIHQTNIRSALPFACETRPLSANEKKLYKVTKLQPLSSFITKMILKLLGHVLRFDDHKVAKQLLYGRPEGVNRPIGLLIFRFCDKLRRDAQFCGMCADIKSLEHIAQDRDKLREFVAAAMNKRS